MDTIFFFASMVAIFWLALWSIRSKSMAQSLWWPFDMRDEVATTSPMERKQPTLQEDRQAGPGGWRARSHQSQNGSVQGATHVDWRSVSHSKAARKDFREVAAAPAAADTSRHTSSDRLPKL